MEMVMDISDFHQSEEDIADSADFSEIIESHGDGLSELGMNLRQDFNLFRI